MADFNTMELMIAVASRELEDGATVGVGTGAPCAAAMLAQKVASPDLVIFFEAGGISPELPEMPISVGDSRTFYKAAMAGSMMDAMEYCSRGLVDYTFLGGAQIDMYGNLNSTVIGDHAKPKVRLPGSGGANDFASFCWRMLVMTPQDKRVDMAEFIARANYGMFLGNFEIDFSDGEVRFKTTITVEDSMPSDETLKRNVYTNVRMMDEYFLGIMGVMYAKLTPEEAVQQIEKE